MKASTMIEDLAKKNARVTAGMKDAFSDEHAEKARLIDEMAHAMRVALPDVVGPVFESTEPRRQARLKNMSPAKGVELIITQNGPQLRVLILLESGGWLGQVRTVADGGPTGAYAATNVELTSEEVASTWSPIAISFALVSLLDRETEGRQKNKARSEKLARRFRAVADLLER